MSKRSSSLRFIRSHLLADIRPLRISPDYRRLWFGDFLSGLGGQMTLVALPIQVYALTQSSVAVGLIGLTQAIPLLTLGLLGGAIADAVDRRMLALVTIGFSALISVLFALQAVLDLRQLWLLYALSVLQACSTAIGAPARRAFAPRLLPPEHLRAANALAMLSFQISMVLGPLIAGMLIATVGLRAAYLVDAVSFLFALYAVARLGQMRVEREHAHRPSPLRLVAEGLRFVRGRPVLRMALAVDLNATIFGMPHALFPALAATHFGGGARVVGLLYAGPALGGLVVSTFSGTLAHIHRQGLAVLCAVAVWGAAIAGFGLSRDLWLAVLLLAAAGGADVVNGVFRGTILQTNTPDSFQGRVSSVGYIVGAGGPRVGDVEAGLVAGLTSPVFSAVSGGLACLAGVIVLGLAVPTFARYRAAPHSTDVEAQAVPAP